MLGGDAFPGKNCRSGFAISDVSMVPPDVNFLCFSFLKSNDVRFQLCAQLCEVLSFSLNRVTIPLPNLDVLVLFRILLICPRHFDYREFLESGLRGPGILASYELVLFHVL